MIVFSNTTPIIALSSIQQIGFVTSFVWTYPFGKGSGRISCLTTEFDWLLDLHVTGTLGVLLKAKQQGLIMSFLECVTTMRNHGIYYHPDLIKKLLNQIGES